MALSSAQRALQALVAARRKAAVVMKTAGKRSKEIGRALAADPAICSSNRESGFRVGTGPNSTRQDHRLRSPGGLALAAESHAVARSWAAMPVQPCSQVEWRTRWRAGSFRMEQPHLEKATLVDEVSPMFRRPAGLANNGASPTPPVADMNPRSDWPTGRSRLRPDGRFSDRSRSHEIAEARPGRMGLPYAGL